VRKAARQALLPKFSELSSASGRLPPAASVAP